MPGAKPDIGSHCLEHLISVTISHVGTGLSTWAILPASPGTLAESWIGPREGTDPRLFQVGKGGGPRSQEPGLCLHFNIGTRMAQQARGMHLPF